jgi:steroid 5-alpha reductase family enzyme
MFYGVIVIYGLFLLLFVIGTIKKNNSIVDMFWGMGFVLSAIVMFAVHKQYNLFGIILLSLVSLWGVRLSYHIIKRNWGKEEDFRYQKWRQDWGKYVVVRALLQVYLSQATLMVIISISIQYGMMYISTFQVVSLIGVVVFLIGYYFQVRGDRELRRFVKTKEKPLLTSGLWSITRHPNYFGESVMWLGFYLFVLLNGGAWWLVVSPITITLILRLISIPLLEKSMMKKEGWDEYSKRVSIFIPYIKL